MPTSSNGVSELKYPDPCSSSGHPYPLELDQIIADENKRNEVEAGEKMISLDKDWIPSGSPTLMSDDMVEEVVLQIYNKQKPSRRVKRRRKSSAKVKETRRSVHVNDSKERLHGCAECSRRYTTKGSLKTHQKIHTGVGYLKCSFCEKFFINKSHLVRHQRVHTGEKPYLCVFCGVEKGQSSSLQAHFSQHHEDNKCKNCGVFFKEWKELCNHMPVCGGSTMFLSHDQDKADNEQIWQMLEEERTRCVVMRGSKLKKSQKERDAENKSNKGVLQKLKRNAKKKEQCTTCDDASKKGRPWGGSAIEDVENGRTVKEEKIEGDAVKRKRGRPKKIKEEKPDEATEKIGKEKMKYMKKIDKMAATINLLKERLNKKSMKTSIKTKVRTKRKRNIKTREEKDEIKPSILMKFSSERNYRCTPVATTHVTTAIVHRDADESVGL